MIKHKLERIPNFETAFLNRRHSFKKLFTHFQSMHYVLCNLVFVPNMLNNYVCDIINTLNICDVLNLLNKILFKLYINTIFIIVDIICMRL